MNSVLNQMLSKYKVDTIVDKKNAIKEIVQEVVLCALSRAGFFKEAAFYGGTALRIFHKLDRFSEDLDFSLLSSNQNFNLTKYLPYIENEVQSLGLNFIVKEKQKSTDSNIRSAFLKGNTKEHILTFYNEKQNINKDEKIIIKFEIDINPPKYATFEQKYYLSPYPFQVKLYDLPSLFAGKIHACLCRNWKTRVKGRDFYDYVYFLSMKTKVNLKHLKARLVQSNFIKNNFNLNIENLKILLNKRFDSLDISQAKNDVLPFIKDKNKINLWTKDFFKEITKNLEAE